MNEYNTQSDLWTDALYAVGRLEKTPRFRQAENIYNLYKPQRVVGHSLGGAIAMALARKYHSRDGVVGVYYSPPLHPFHALHPYEESYANWGDPVSIGDVSSHRSIRIGNPHGYLL